MHNKVFNTYLSTITFVPEYYNSQEMCDKVVVSSLFMFDSIPDKYKTLKMSHKAVSNDPLMLKYCLDSYKIQEVLWNQKNVFVLRRWWNIYPKNEYDRLVLGYKTYLYQKIYLNNRSK